MNLAVEHRHLVERAAGLLRDGLPPPLPFLRAQALRPTPDAPPAATLTAALTSAALEAAGLADGAGRRTRVTEEFSIAGGNLIRAVRAAPGRRLAGAQAEHEVPGLVMVTSAKPDEGKSFSALNLAASLARGGLARVVLADIDPKLGSLTSLLGLDGLPGVLDLAADPSRAPDALLVRGPIRDLAVMPLGSRDAARGDRAMASRLGAAATRIGRLLPDHLVLLDAPPCLATSEPAALAALVGVVLVVVEAERTQRHELEQSLEMLKPCPNVVLLLNKLRGAASPGFGDYDYYGA